MDVHVFAEPKVDCHVHVLDPARFPYDANTHYAPAGQELGTPAQLHAVMRAYGTRHALLVGPNSGYGLDNACMLDTIARAPDRFKGIAVVRNDASLDALRMLKAQGVVGIAWNVTFYGVDHYDDAQTLLDRLAQLDLFVDIQVRDDQLVRMLPLLMACDARILIDHCALPTVAAGLSQPGFEAALALGATERACVKLSGFAKNARTPAPYADVWPYVRALVDAYTLDRCLWASDWPYLRAPERVDYGVLLDVTMQLFPDEAERRKLLWDTPRALFGF